MEKSDKDGIDAMLALLANQLCYKRSKFSLPLSWDDASVNAIIISSSKAVQSKDSPVEDTGSLIMGDDDCAS